MSTYLDYQTVDINAMIAGLLSVKHGYYNYSAELRTAGKCFEWAMDHLADEVSKVPPGANGVIFTPGCMEIAVRLKIPTWEGCF